MSANELRTARLKELHRKLLDCEPMYAVFHAAIRSDDPAIASLFTGEGHDDFLFPPSICNLFLEKVCFDDEVLDKDYLRKRRSFRELLARATNEKFANSEFRDRDVVWKCMADLREIAWDVVASEYSVGHRVAEIAPPHRDSEEWEAEIQIAGCEWHGRFFSSVDQTDTCLKMKPLADLVRGELLTLRHVYMHTSWNVATDWVEVLYWLLPQPTDDLDGIKSIMLPWNLAEASARAVERLIDEPTLRFEGGPPESRTRLFTPAELCLRLDAMSADRLSDYAKEAKVETPARGGREHRYDSHDAIRICKTIIGSNATVRFKQAARQLLNELTGESAV